MAKNQNSKPAAAPKAAPATKPTAIATATAQALQLDWNREADRMTAIAKDIGGSRADQLGKVAKYIVQDKPGAHLLRERASQPAPVVSGAQAFGELSRNTLSKLVNLADRIASGAPWCAPDAVLPTASRTADASVAVALATLFDGDTRQKSVIAQALARYPHGAGAQMGAALDACAFMGVVHREGERGTRNAVYTIANEAQARALMPRTLAEGAAAPKAAGSKAAK